MPEQPDPVEIESLGLGVRRIGYQAAWDYQRELHARVASGEIPGRVLLLEHEPVYTAGRRTEPHERPFDGTPVVDVDRGGKITWHGPGQLVGYPIIRLPGRVGVVDHVRRMEQAVIDMLSELDVLGVRVEGRTGVWLHAERGRPERKICAIGIRVAKRTTMHGFAVNVESQTRAFENIVPCGISDAGVTSIAAETREAVSLTDIADRLGPHLRRCLDYATPYADVVHP